MKKSFIKIIAFAFVLVISLTVFAACTQAERVSYNVSKEADNFNVTRRLAVINARTDKPVFELVGNFAISNNDTQELEVTCEVAKGVYKKHYIYLNEWTIYVVEDVSGAYVNPYHYEVNFLPEMIVPIEITTND